MILHTYSETKAQESDADKVMAILCTAYPGHPWAVSVYQGVIFIRHLQLGNLTNKQYGMNIKWGDVNHDAAVLKKKVILYAGEWLERAGLKRGRENGDQIERVEGIPDERKPVDLVIAKDLGELRTHARPQVIR